MRVVSDDAKPGLAKCRDCGRLPGGARLTFAEQMKQFWRAVNAGLTQEEAKGASPRCQKCMTVFLRERKRA